MTSDQELKEFLPDNLILPIVVNFNIIRKFNKNDKITFHHGAGNELTIGNISNNDKINKLFNSLIKPINVKFKIKTTIITTKDEFNSFRHSKLLFNLLNSINFLAGISLRDTLLDLNFRRIYSHLLNESLNVYKESNIKIKTKTIINES